MARLRSPDGCPWDRAQTLESLRANIIEESYELIDAIDKNDDENIREELGDCLLQVVFVCRILEEEGKLSLNDVITTLNDKLLFRHPHVFGDLHASSPAEAKARWDQMKEKKKGKSSSPLKKFRKFPALTEAYYQGRESTKIGFDWSLPEDVLAKVAEEAREVEEAWRGREKGEKTEEELGDLLFSVAQLARKMEINPELALKRANDKFRRRYERLLTLLEGEEKPPSPELLERFWEKIKGEENS